MNTSTFPEPIDPETKIGRLQALSVCSISAAMSMSGAGSEATGAGTTPFPSVRDRLGRREGAALTSDSVVAAVEM